MVCLIGIFSITYATSNTYADKYVESHYYYNQNKFTGATNNWRSIYKWVVNSSKIRYSSRSIVGGGWNYNTWLVFFHWS